LPFALINASCIDRAAEFLNIVKGNPRTKEAIDNITRSERAAFGFPKFQPSFLVTPPLILKSDVKDILDNTDIAVYVYYGEEDSTMFDGAHIIKSTALPDILKEWQRDEYSPNAGLSLLCTATASMVEKPRDRFLVVYSRFTPHRRFCTCQFLCPRLALE
jgi:hypothetical protein